MAGPVLGFGQVNGYQIQQQPNINLGVNVKNPTPEEKKIQPQGSKLAGSEESNPNKQNASFDAQKFAEQLLSQQENVQRGSVIDVLI